jgi:predicted alpha/beta-hydrolase family hydrolase
VSDTLVEPFSESGADGPGVRGTVHRPVRPTGPALVLTHGAGSDHTTVLLAAVAGAISARGVLVLRCDLPFRQQQPAGPPSPAGAAHDREGLRRALQVAGRFARGPLYLGGHSYGGRQASMLAAEDPTLAAGLLLLAYPLHPPHRPGQTRTAHLGQIAVPALFVHGTRDPFGSVDELRTAASMMGGPTDVLVIEGAPHSLVPPRRDGIGVAAIAARIAVAFGALVVRDQAG